MEQQELFERVAKWLDEVYFEAITHGEQAELEYYNGANAMAHRFISQFFTEKIDIEREENGKHRIVDYRG